MKKASFILLCLLFGLTILYPLGVVTTALFGYRFVLINPAAFAVALAMLSACVVFLERLFEGVSENKMSRVLLTIISPFSFINAVFYIFERPQIWVIASVLISAGCCCYLTIKYGRPLPLKTVALILSALMILPIAFLSFTALVFGDFGQNTVVQTVASPSGKYSAQVIESSQGALGGDTFVDVYDNSAINAILFKIEKNPQRVYCGDWGEFENMQIHWKDDGCLIINSVEYQIQ